MDEFGGSVGGGGRYDKMIGKFTGQDTPACGFSIGFERIVMLLLESGYQVPGKQAKKGISDGEKACRRKAMLKVSEHGTEQTREGRQAGADRQYEEE